MNDAMDADEYLEIVDDKGEVIGLALRSEVHGNPDLRHRVVHVLVFNSEGALLLQKRSMNKDVAPGRWDTSVGGHVGVGEGLMDSALREMAEELGVTASAVEHLYSYTHRNPYETELVTTFRCIHDGPVNFSREEIDEVRYWSHEEILAALGQRVLSKNFEDEYRMYLRYQTPRQSGP